MRMIDSSFSHIGKSLFDVLIVGAGINGCATAKELSRLGYRVLLVDRGDFGGATTARSGRVLHCGLQLLAPSRSLFDYLKNPLELATRLRSARRAVRDFKEFQHDLPRQLEPMTTFVPIFRDSPYRGWQVDLGARIIAAFGRGADFRYRRQGSAESRSNPFVDDLREREALQSLISFQDFRFCWPERMAIDAALAAERTGAMVLNFTQVVDLARAADGIWHAKLAPVRDDGTEKEEVSARVVLNLAGAWVDDVIATVNPRPPANKKIAAVKGVYLLVKLPDRYRGLGLAGTNSIGEPICCLPWDDLHYIGPTETPFTGELEDVRPNEEDVAFLLVELAKYAPGLRITRSSMIMAWAGVRPITAAAGHSKGKRLPFNVIHDLASEGMPNMLALSWGIVANHRSTARTLAGAVSSRIRPSGRARQLRGGLAIPPGTGQRLQNDHPTTDGDVRFCVEHEHAKDLSGVLFSRTGVGWTGRMTAETVQVAANAMAPLLCWSRIKTEAECEAFRAKLKADYCYELK